MKKNKNIVPILIVVVIVLVVVASMLLPKITLKTKNPVEGEYDCTGLDDHTDEYLISLYLYNDGTFLYGPYGKLDDNHAKGTYTYEHEKEKDGKVKDYKYYMLNFKGDAKDFISDGKSLGRDFESQMEFGLTEQDGKRQGVVIFVSSYNMYYCYAK